MEVWMNSYREMVLFYHVYSHNLSWMLRNGVGDPNERDTMQKYFAKFYAYAKDGLQKDFEWVAIYTDMCRNIIERYTVPSE